MIKLVSKELEIGKCGEHFALFSLVKQGFTAFLSDQGLPYDIVVDYHGKLYRGQVKSTLKVRDCGKSKNIYRFGTRAAKKNARKASVENCEFYAFVAIEDQKIAFMTTKELESSSNPGYIKQTIDLRSNDINYLERVYTNGTIKKYSSAICIEDFSDFNRIITNE